MTSPTATESDEADGEPVSTTGRKLTAVAVAVLVVVVFLLGQRHDRPPGLEPPF